MTNENQELTDLLENMDFSGDSQIRSQLKHKLLNDPPQETGNMVYLLQRVAVVTFVFIMIIATVPPARNFAQEALTQLGILTITDEPTYQEEQINEAMVEPNPQGDETEAGIETLYMPTLTATASPTHTMTLMPTIPPTVTPPATPTPVPTFTVTNIATLPPMATPTFTATSVPTHTVTPTSTLTPISTKMPTVTPNYQFLIGDPVDLEQLFIDSEMDALYMPMVLDGEIVLLDGYSNYKYGEYVMTMQNRQNREITYFTQRQHITPFELHVDDGATITDVMLRNHSGVWIEGNVAGILIEQMSVNSLLWEEDGYHFEVAGRNLTLSTALQIAESLQVYHRFEEANPNAQRIREAAIQSDLNEIYIPLYYMQDKVTWAWNEVTDDYNRLALQILPNIAHWGVIKYTQTRYEDATIDYSNATYSHSGRLEAYWIEDTLGLVEGEEELIPTNMLIWEENGYVFQISSPHLVESFAFSIASTIREQRPDQEMEIIIWSQSRDEAIAASGMATVYVPTNLYGSVNWRYGEAGLFSISTQKGNNPVIVYSQMLTKPEAYDSPSITDVEVRGHQGQWLLNVEESVRVTVNILAWEENGYYFEIRGEGLTLDDALEMAESLRADE